MKSSLNWPLPVTRRLSSARRTGWPMKRKSGVSFIGNPGGGAVRKPGMRQPRAWPGGGAILDEVDWRRLPRLGRDQRRAVVTVAHLGADHLVRLALLDIGHAREIGAGLGALGRVVADVRLP